MISFDPILGTGFLGGVVLARGHLSLPSFHILHVQLVGMPLFVLQFISKR